MGFKVSFVLPRVPKNALQGWFRLGVGDKTSTFSRALVFHDKHFQIEVVLKACQHTIHVGVEALA